MPNTEKKTVEEVPAEEVEVMNPENSAKVRKISADEPYQNTSGDHPLFPFLSNIEEFKKIRFFSFLAIILSMIGIKFYPLYIESAAIALALLDLWKGSKFTRKLAFFTLIFSGFILLSNWQ